MKRNAATRNISSRAQPLVIEISIADKDRDQVFDGGIRTGIFASTRKALEILLEEVAAAEGISNAYEVIINLADEGGAYGELIENGDDGLMVAATAFEAIDTTFWDEYSEERFPRTNIAAWAAQHHEAAKDLLDDMRWHDQELDGYLSEYPDAVAFMAFLTAQLEQAEIAGALSGAPQVSATSAELSGGQTCGVKPPRARRAL